MLIAFGAGAYLFLDHVSRLPFRALNDKLHKTACPVTLDMLIPAGVHIDDKITVGEVAGIRLREERGILDRTARHIAGLIPPGYRVITNFALFFFWSFLYLIFLRVFTFAGYGRCIRISLLAGGITYYFMPDFSAGRWDDAAFITLPFLIILLRSVWRRRKKAQVKTL
ncbi:hypothetical protein GW860_06440 [bacterium]|nr:hypothetical protein [bacterium]OIP40883.1 MAG: hypothetical protein AUK25_06895 [Desulfobacteraceae bacterium CG2_30_51_40]